MFAVPLEGVLGQRAHHDLRGLHEARAGLFHGNAEAGVLDAGRAAAEAEQAAAAAEDVEERDLLGHPHRVVPGQDDHRRAQDDAARPPRVVAQELGGGRGHGVAGEVVLEGEEGVEAEGLGQVAEGQMLGDHRRVGVPSLGQHVKRDPDFMTRLLSPPPPTSSYRVPRLGRDTRHATEYSVPDQYGTECPYANLRERYKASAGAVKVGPEPTARHRAADRVIDMLEPAAPSREGLALKDVSRGVETPKSSLLPLLRTLTARGYLEQGRDGEYRLGPRRWSWARGRGGAGTWWRRRGQPSRR